MRHATAEVDASSQRPSVCDQRATATDTQHARRRHSALALSRPAARCVTSVLVARLPLLAADMRAVAAAWMLAILITLCAVSTAAAAGTPRSWLKPAAGEAAPELPAGQHTARTREGESVHRAVQL